MLYSNDSDDAVRACEEARTGFYGYDEGESSADDLPEVHMPLWLAVAFREDAHQKAMREYRERFR